MLTAVLNRLGERRRQRELRSDYRAGVIGSIIVNVNTKKGAKVMRPADLFPDVSELLEDDTIELEDYINSLRGSG